jgi:putative addiction module component (TIGR02574 family)
MAESVPVPPAEFAQLSQDGKLAYIERLYDIVDAQGIELTDEQRALLDQRLRQHQADPNAARPWSEVRDELLQRWR